MTFLQGFRATRVNAQDIVQPLPPWCADRKNPLTAAVVWTSFPGAPWFSAACARLPLVRDLPNLDLMRSFAVTLVVACHVLTYSPHFRPAYPVWFIGLLGVFLFFTHTTLVLMWSLDRDPHTLRFYLRRAFRIYPLWIAVLAASVLVHLPTSPLYAPNFGFQHAGRRELLENLTLTFNLDRGCHLIGASWSLPIEVQMYVVLPFLFFFMRHNRSLWPLLLVDALAMATSTSQEFAACQTLLFCTPLFLPGAMAYLRFKHQQPVLPAWLFPVWLLALTVGFNSFASVAANSFRSGWVYALLIGLSLPMFRQIRWAPLCRVTHLVARYSYGLYLFHFAAIAVGVQYLRHQSPWVRVLGFVATLSCLSVLGYHAVEKPMIRLGSRLAGRIGHGREPAANEGMLSLEPAP